MSIVLSIALVISTVAFIYPHLGYPPTLYLLSRLKRPHVPGSARPYATLIISAFNEAEVIREKIENAIALEYPRELLEVFVISDASDDDTDRIVEEYADQNVRLCRQQERLGKSAGLTRFCPQAGGDILVFTDANSMFQADSLTNLLRHFDDPDIGYTVGSQRYRKTDRCASADSENVYWNIELKLKEWESRLSSVVGGDGAIYALRKEFFEPLAPEDINDFVLPLRIVAQGYRGIFDPQAICFEHAAPDFRGEFRRKLRIVNRSLHAAMKVPQAFNPLRVGWFSFQLIAHKVLRWFSPLFMLVMLLTSGYLAVSEWRLQGRPGDFGLIVAMQLGGYLTAALYLISPLRSVRVIYIAYYFLLINCAAAVGIALLLSGHTIGVWKPQR